MSEEAALQLTNSVVVDRPIEEVWAYLNDETKDPEWRRPYIKRLRRLGPLGVGTRFEGVDNLGSYVSEITRFEPPFRLSWRETSKRSMVYRDSSYILTPEGTGTKVTIALAFDTLGLKGKVIGMVLPLMMKSLSNKLAKQLKEGVEAPNRG